jgi:serine/threonine protein kinase
VERDAQGQPRPWSGSFAVVYKGTDPTGAPRAIRVFTTESPQRRERYDRISEHLKARKPDCLVNFEYREAAIRSPNDGQWYPLVLMDWVEGPTLFDWLRGKCLEKDKGRLEKAATLWLSVVDQLLDAEVSHGDLQHSNVLVTPAGHLKLVDYDGMCVPALAGQRNLELGVPPYQHPQRGRDTLLSLKLDRFSALLICVALRALAADPSLWGKYVEAPNYDKVLFRVEDFREPDDSPLRRDLRRSPDRQVRDLSERLFVAARGHLGDVPCLRELAAEHNGRAVVPSAVGPLVESPKAADAKAAAKPLSRTVSALGTRPPGLSALKIADYEFRELLGKGALGAVYKAVRKRDSQPVAVQIVPAGAAVTAYQRSRLVRELAPVLRLRHPNIVALLESGWTENTAYLVMENCEGGNLGQLMSHRGGKLPLAEARPLMSQCLDALQHAHLRHVVHGNLKPRSILLAPSPRGPIAKIADFWRTVVSDLLGASTISNSHSPIEDYQWVARERLTAAHQCRPLSDLWSLAAIFYYALTGRFPRDFRAGNPIETILTAEHVPMRGADGAVPPAVADVIDRALQTNPNHRFRTASEMKLAWELAF